MKSLDIEKLLKPCVKRLKPYVAENIMCRAKLDANESPMGFELGMPGIETNRYPDPDAKELKRALTKLTGARPAQMLTGNGSDEIIGCLINAFGGPVLYPTPTFSMYGIIACAQGQKVVPVPLDRSFDIDIDRTMKAIKKHKPKLIFLSSPNNPTGNCFSSGSLLKIIESANAVVIIDEAYAPFSGKRGFMPVIADYPNLAVLRTLSKIGLAALRVGYLTGSERLIKAVEKVRLPFNLNSYSMALAIEAIKNKASMDGIIKLIVSERDRLYSALSVMDGVYAYPSEANFILFKVKNQNSVFEGLLRKGVLVRNMGESVNGCLRVTVGTKYENDLFLKALKTVL